MGFLLKSFSAKIFSLGINPCVNMSQDVLRELFKQAGRTKGPIPVRGKLNGTGFKQTVVKYQGAWRLYLNTQMRQDARVDVGDYVTVQLQFDPEPRPSPMDPKLRSALSMNKEAKAAFERLSPSRQKEILRYLGSLKTERSILRNTEKIVQYLLGERRALYGRCSRGPRRPLNTVTTREN